MKSADDFKHVPYDIEIEQALLGAILVDNDAIGGIGDLKPEHFYDPLHQRIFEVIQLQALKGGMVLSPLTLHALLKADPGLVEVGGHAYLAGLAQATPAMPNIRDYSRILQDLATRRALIAIGGDVVNAAYEAPHEFPAQQQVEAAHAAIDKLQVIGNQSATRITPLQSVIDISLEKAERHLRGEDVIQGVTTGIRKLDAVIGSLQAADRLLLASRSSMGKSALADTFARASAAAGNPTLIISADMNSRQWANRSICAVDYELNFGEQPIHYSKFRNGTLSNREIERLVMARRHMADWPIEIDDQGNQTTASIRRKVRAMAKKFPGLQGRLVVDFIQQIEPAEKRHQSRRDEDLTAVAYELGNIVKDIGWDLVALAQMKNKDTDSKGQLKETPPTLADIRESGGLEMAADIILTPFRKAWFIERREPDGLHDAGGPSASWKGWRAELSEHAHAVRLIGLKNREDTVSNLNLLLHCEMGSNAIMDEFPERPADMRQQALALDALSDANAQA